MTENDVRGWMLALKGSIADDDAETALESALELIQMHMLTQVRIAEALEDIRNFGSGQANMKSDLI